MPLDRPKVKMVCWKVLRSIMCRKNFFIRVYTASSHFLMDSIHIVGSFSVHDIESSNRIPRAHKRMREARPERKKQTNSSARRENSYMQHASCRSKASNALLFFFFFRRAVSCQLAGGTFNFIDKKYDGKI